MVEGVDLFKGVDVLEIRGEIPEQLRRLCCDSRMVQEDDLFVALRGTSFDGHHYLADVAARRVGAAVVETVNDSLALPQIRVADTLASLPVIAANYYGHPSRELHLIGITGSNGKTTSTYILESIWKAAQQQTAVVGTIEYRFGDKRIEAPNTTPLPHEMQRLLREIVQERIQWVMMEVSSHGLALHRVDQIVFDAALFTNLSQDHLDFHRDMDEYRETKQRLFTEHLKHNAPAVINIDDEAGRRMQEAIQSHRIVSYGIQNEALVMAKQIELGLQETTFTLHFPDRTLSVRSRLLGFHNIYNLLGAAAAAWACGISGDQIQQGIENVKPVPGRLEIVPTTIGAQVVVDYCHTPDALQKCLEALQAIPHRRLMTVFGCGGDRDAKKRPLMGAIALRYSDRVIVTSDNPRTEDPMRIIQDIESGMESGKQQYVVISNRREAIHTAIESLKANDIVLIAGKGHETYQIIGREKHAFDDRAIARQYLAEMGKGEGK